MTEGQTRWFLGERLLTATGVCQFEQKKGLQNIFTVATVWAQSYPNFPALRQPQYSQLWPCSLRYPRPGLLPPNCLPPTAATPYSPGTSYDIHRLCRLFKVLLQLLKGLQALFLGFSYCIYASIRRSHG